MGVALGWIVFALAGVGAAPQTDRNDDEIIYTVQYLQTEGLGWREAMFAQLKPVARQGGATIWTAPHALAKQLIAQVSASRAGKVVQVPKVVAYSGGPCHITSRSNQELVTQVAWGGDDHAAAPIAEKVRTGWVMTMVGRTLDQGVLVQLVIEDTAITAVHDVNVSEPCESGCAKAASAWVPKPASFAGAASPGGKRMVAKRDSGETETVCSEEKCAKAQGCCETADDDPLEEDADVQQLTIAVPEIRSQEVAGLWLIPKDEVLLVSFGVYTAADRNGKAVVKERLAMIAVAEMPGEGSRERSRRMAYATIVPSPNRALTSGVMVPQPVPMIAPPPVVVPAAPFYPFPADGGQHAMERAPLLVPALPANPAMPLPAVPSRTMPEGVHKDGTISNLPPLPDEIEQPTSESSEPMASPQTKKHQQAKPATDAKATKAAFAPRVTPQFSIPSLFLPSAPSTPSGLQFLLPIKPFSIKLPFNQRLEIEVFGRLVPDTEPSSKPAEQTED